MHTSHRAILDREKLSDVASVNRARQRAVRCVTCGEHIAYADWIEQVWWGVLANRLCVRERDVGLSG